MKKALLLVGVLVVVATAALVFLKPKWFGLSGWEEPVVEAPASVELLETMRTALAETENLNPDAAEPLWLEALQQRPSSSDALQNLIVTRISRLNELRKSLNDPTVDPAEKAAIEGTFPLYQADAVDAIERLRKLAEGNEDRALLIAADWFSGRLSSVAAGSNVSAESRAQMRLALERTGNALTANPEALPLVGLIDELTQLTSDPIDGISPEEARQLLPALDAAVAATPRNAFSVATALGFAIIAQDPKAADYAMQLQELAKPIVELIRRDAGSFEVDSFGQQIADFVRQGNWDRALGLQRPWLNLLRGTEMMKVDRKRANPNVLDFVATGAINAMATELADEVKLPAATSPLLFSEPVSLETEIEHPVAITSVDFSLANPPEIAVASDHELVILKLVDNVWTEWARRNVNPGVRGMVQAELFPADASDPLRLKRPTPKPDQVNPAQELELAKLAKAHDTYPGLILWGAGGIELIRFDGRPDVAAELRLLDSPRTSGLEGLRNVLAVQPADIDADGDLDLIVSTESEGVSIWINRGDLTFFSVSQFSDLPPVDDPVVAMAIGDLDRDIDIDVVTMQRSGRLGWLENLLHLQMRWAPLAGVAVDPQENATGTGIAVAEWDGNVSWDVVHANSNAVSVMTTETTGIGMTRMLENQFLKTNFDAPETVAAGEATESETTGPAFGGQLIVADLDNDSWPDIVMYGRSGIIVVRGSGKRLEDANKERVVEGNVSGLTVADFNSDGKLDLAFILNGTPVVAMNETNAGQYIAVQMKGIDDNATGRVNHFAIGSTLEVRFGPHYRAQVIDQRTTYFGLGAVEKVDTLRAILTNGITQNSIQPPVNTTLIEDQSLKGSCPYLYTWDGDKFVFVTDCLWAAPLGLQYALGKVVPDRPWEYLKVDGKYLQPRDGKYEIRLTEELWELAYFDHVSLIAVDHPADVEIWTNEKVGPPEAVQPKIFTIKETRPIAKAISSRGEDCTELLNSIDEQYVQGFVDRYRQGLCPEHWVELELGEIAAQDRVLLLMTGWILPTDSSLNIQIDQNPELPSLQPPSVWIPNNDGNAWTCSIPAMGFPGGKTKTIVVDLTDKLNLNDPRIRIQTTAQIYWDAAALAVNPPDIDIVVTPLEMTSARVGYRGFSASLPRDSTQPQRYDYYRVSAEPKWPPLSGTLTREGDCKELLSVWDDQMAVIAGGDEIQVQFQVPEVTLPQGWKRDFILHSVGWDKDADLNTLEGQNVGPLPFKAMQTYPPPSSQYHLLDHVERQNAWHRTREQPFRTFWDRH